MRVTAISGVLRRGDTEGVLARYPALSRTETVLAYVARVREAERQAEIEAP